MKVVLTNKEICEACAMYVKEKHGYEAVSAQLHAERPNVFSQDVVFTCTLEVQPKEGSQ